MESEGLKQFLKSVGDAVYSLNTICIGLNGVALEVVSKPDDLTITWKTSDPKRTAMSARRFAICSALVFVEEALLNYIDFLSTCSNQTSKVVSACKVVGAAEKIFQLSKQVRGLEEYWLPFVTLMVRWRNKVVHNSSTNLSPFHRELILEHSCVIKERHAGISVKETIKNYDNQKITLKDFSTMIAITIKFVRHIDSSLMPTVATLKSFKKQITERELGHIFKCIVGVNGSEKQRSKFRAFINSNFTSIDDGEFEELFKIRHEIAREI